MHIGAYRLSPSDDPKEGGPEGLPGDPHSAGREDLPYKVEVWDDTKTRVEQVLAATASASIGYAAFYAATREFPQQYITLRHKDRVITRWIGPLH